MQLQVIGKTWEGFHSSYGYEVETVPKSDADALRVAGDFQELTDWQVVQSTVKVRAGKGWHKETTRTEIVKPWAKPDSQVMMQGRANER